MSQMYHFKRRTETTPLTLSSKHVTPILLYLNEYRQCTEERDREQENEETSIEENRQNGEK